MILPLCPVCKIMTWTHETDSCVRSQDIVRSAIPDAQCSQWPSPLLGTNSCHEFLLPLLFGSTPFLDHKVIKTLKPTVALLLWLHTFSHCVDYKHYERQLAHKAQCFTKNVFFPILLWSTLMQNKRKRSHKAKWFDVKISYEGFNWQHIGGMSFSSRQTKK